METLIKGLPALKRHQLPSPVWDSMCVPFSLGSQKFRVCRNEGKGFLVAFA